MDSNKTFEYPRVEPGLAGEGPSNLPLWDIRTLRKNNSFIGRFTEDAVLTWTCTTP
jgi:hypothetical protein